jgi:hypothetical protein
MTYTNVTQLGSTHDCHICPGNDDASAIVHIWLHMFNDHGILQETTLHVGILL